MKKVAIVILNYINYEDTIDCINCALDQSYENTRIIVVDNGSTNPSYDILKFIYARNKRVKILKSNKNLGFARGNNIGIRYARNHCKADYVFVCNNDVIFERTLIEEFMSKEYEGVGAFSPTVYQLDGGLQAITIVADEMYAHIRRTMVRMGLEWLRQVPFVEALNQMMKNRRKSIWRSIDGAIQSELDHINTKDDNKMPNESKELKEGKEPKVGKEPKEGKEPKNNEEQKVNNEYRYQLQGCAFVLTPSFFQYYQQLYPNTFLYWEEINLLVYLQKVGLKSSIIHTSPCIHKGMGATQHLLKSKKKARRRLWYSTHSLFRSIPMHYTTYKQIVKKYNG